MLEEEEEDDDGILRVCCPRLKGRHVEAADANDDVALNWEEGDR